MELEIPSIAVDRRVIIFGELHGTNEIPKLVETFSCNLLRRQKTVVVGLEIASSEQEPINRFMASEGSERDLAALLEGAFWSKNIRYGYNSKAIASLIAALRRLRAQGFDVEVLAFDDQQKIDFSSGTVTSREIGRRREIWMAGSVDRAIERAPNKTFVLLTGNLHAGKSTTIAGQEGYQTLAYLLDKKYSVVSFDVEHSGGTAWNCVPKCGIHRIEIVDGEASQMPIIRLNDKRTNRFPSGFDGTYYAGKLTASQPAVPEQ